MEGAAVDTGSSLLAAFSVLPWRAAAEGLLPDAQQPDDLTALTKMRTGSESDGMADSLGQAATAVADELEGIRCKPGTAVSR